MRRMSGSPKGSPKAHKMHIVMDDEMKKDMTSIFRIYDDDNSMYLEREEFKHFINDLRASLYQPSIDNTTFKKIIKIMDENNDRKISLAEMVEKFPEIYPIIEEPGEELEHLIKSLYDYIGFDIEEPQDKGQVYMLFKQICHKFDAEQSQIWQIEYILEAIDVNGDRHLDFDEIRDHYLFIVNELIRKKKGLGIPSKIKKSITKILNILDDPDGTSSEETPRINKFEQNKVRLFSRLDTSLRKYRFQYQSKVKAFKDIPDDVNLINDYSKNYNGKTVAVSDLVNDKNSNELDNIDEEEFGNKMRIDLESHKSMSIASNNSLDRLGNSQKLVYRFSTNNSLDGTQKNVSKLPKSRGSHGRKNRFSLQHNETVNDSSQNGSSGKQKMSGSSTKNTMPLKPPIESVKEKNKKNVQFPFVTNIQKDISSNDPSQLNKKLEKYYDKNALDFTQKVINVYCQEEQYHFFEEFTVENIECLAMTAKRMKIVYQNEMDKMVKFIRGIRSYILYKTNIGQRRTNGDFKNFEPERRFCEL